MPTLKKRVDVIWIALALTAGAGGAVLANASSPADEPGPTAPGPLRIAAAEDPALTGTDPSDAEAAARLAMIAGVPAAPGAGPQTWTVGGRSVLGYRTSGGSFCFAFSEGAGGCLQPDTLADEQPLDVMVDHGPGTFNVYGLALDGVTAVAVEVGGTTRNAAFAHNSFSLSDADMAETEAVEGEAVATMSDGTTRSVPFRIGSLDTQS